MSDKAGFLDNFFKLKSHNTDIHTGEHLGVTARAGKKLRSVKDGPLNFIKYIAKEGETLIVF